MSKQDPQPPGEVVAGIGSFPFVQGWATAVARFLGFPVPAGVRVEVHGHPGFPWTDGSIIHVFTNSSGVDLDKVPHELVHVIAGLSPSRFVSEGLAVHVADQLHLGVSCWPCFRLTPDLWVAEMRGRPAGVPKLRGLIEEAETVHLRGPTPDGAAISRAWRMYVIAGSFVGWLYRRVDAGAFWDGYGNGCFWQDEREFRALEANWLRSLPESLDLAGRDQLVASLQDAERQRPEVGVASAARGHSSAKVLR